MSRQTALRVKGFTKDWSQHKLLDNVQKIVDFRGRTPKKLGMDWSDSGYLALSALNVKDGYIDFSQDVHYGDQALYDKWMAGNDLHQGQVLFTTEAPMGNVAQVPDDKKYILSQRTIAFEVDENLVTEDFFAVALRSPAVFQTLTALSSGGTAKGVSQKSLASVDITIPQDLNEQHDLAELFLLIDKFISFHQRKYDKLLMWKKAMLEKMFPKDGADVPEVRFSGYETAWKQHKLGEIIIEKLSNGIMNCPGTENSLIRHINVVNMYTADKIHVEDLTYSGYGISHVQKCNVEYGDIFLTRSSLKPEGIAEPNVLLDSGDYVYDDHLIRMKVDKEYYDPCFVKICLESAFVKKQFISRSKTTAFTTIGQEDIEDCSGLFPNLTEQRRIADFFSRLNSLIALQQSKLSKLKDFKSALLDKMFI